ESWTHADRTYRLGTLMHELNQLPQAPERMPVEHREFLQEQARTAEAATDEIERVKTADTALAARVHTLRQDGYLAAAWAATQEHVATLRRSQDLSVHDIDALPVGRLRAEILVQARGLEQALDRERTEQGELSAQQRESYTERYQRACPHLDREQIRERSEERRVGKEGRSGRWAHHGKKEAAEAWSERPTSCGDERYTSIRHECRQ